MTTELVNVSDRLLEKMSKQDLKQVKSLSGLVETSCRIVEESYRRLNKHSKSEDKRDTAIKLVQPLLEKLRREDLVTETLKLKLEEKLESTEIGEMIDDTIDAWQDRVGEVKYYCTVLDRFVKLFIRTRKAGLEALEI